MAKKREEWLGPDPVLMNDEDFAKIQSNSDAWFAARDRGDQAAMDALHADSERIRSKYDYSGGTAGIEYDPFPKESQDRYEFGTPADRPSAYRPQYAQELEALTQQQAPAFRSQYAGDIAALTERQAPAYTPRYDEQLKALGGRTAPAYQSKYDAELEELTRALLAREPFSYDPETDPQYRSYRKEYAREGQRAAADALGGYAAMTGGMPSTAAVTASQQAGDYYGAKMADAIPELYRNAYQMYLDEQNAKVRDINALRQLEDSDYARYVNDVDRFNTDRSFDYSLYSQLANDDRNRYLTELSQYNTDRDFNYSVLDRLDQNDRNDYQTALGQWNADRAFNAGVYGQLEDDAYRQYLGDLDQWNTDRAYEYGRQRDAAEDARYEDETAYQRGRDALGDARYEDELAYRRERDALEDALELARLGAGYGSYDRLRELGIEPDFDAMLGAELAQRGRVAPVGAGSGGSGGSWGGGSGGSGSAARRSEKSVTAGDKSRLDYDPDEGIFTWNGKSYKSLKELKNSIKSSTMTDDQRRSLKKAFRAYGFDVKL